MAQSLRTGRLGHTANPASFAAIRCLAAGAAMIMMAYRTDTGHRPLLSFAIRWVDVNEPEGSVHDDARST
jgi:hypothetical protein